MSSLADLPELVGFFSYSRDDDEGFGRQLSSLRNAIREELAAALGRNKRNFDLWQDQDSIAPGEMWETEITKAINQATFFIPIVTPRAVRSEYCKFEFNAFLTREKALGRSNLIFPILYIDVPELSEDSKWRSNPVLSVIGARKFVDWRKQRHLPIETPAYREAIADFCAKIADALREPLVLPEQPSTIGKNLAGSAQSNDKTNGPASGSWAIFLEAILFTGGVIGLFSQLTTPPKQQMPLFSLSQLYL